MLFQSMNVFPTLYLIPGLLREFLVSLQTARRTGSQLCWNEPSKPGDTGEDKLREVLSTYPKTRPY